MVGFIILVLSIVLGLKLFNLVYGGGCIGTAGAIFRKKFTYCLVMFFVLGFIATQLGLV